MKFNRIISATLAIGMMFCTFTACGDDDDSSKSGGAAKKPEDVIEILFDGFNDRDAKKISSAMYPKGMIEDLKKNDKESYDEILEDFEETFKDFDDEYGDDWKVKYDIRETEKMSDEEISDWNDEYADWYDYYDLAAPKVTDGAYVTVKFSVKGKESSDDKGKEDFPVLKVDGNWYLTDF